MGTSTTHRAGILIAVAISVSVFAVALTGVAGAVPAADEEPLDVAVDENGLDVEATDGNETVDDRQVTEVGEDDQISPLQQPDTGWEETVTGAITTDEPQEEWVFSVAAGDEITAELTRTGGSGTLHAVLYDIEAEEVLAGTQVEPDGSGQMAGIAPTTGEYLVAVFGQEPDDVGDYSLTIGVGVGEQPPGPGTDFEEVEPNDDFETADPIDRDVPVSGVLTQGDVDVFAFDAEAGEDFSIDYARATADGVQAVVVYDPDQQFLDASFVGSDQPVSLEVTAEANGTHYVQVIDVEQGTGPYSIQVSEGEPEPIDTGVPGELLLESGDSVDGEIVEYYMWDEYVFEGEAGDEVAFELTRTGGEGILWLFIEDDSGELIAYTQVDPDSTETLQVVLPATGMYVAAVGGGQPGDAGAYTLTMTEEELPDPGPFERPWTGNDGTEDDASENDNATNTTNSDRLNP